MRPRRDARSSATWGQSLISIAFLNNFSGPSLGGGEIQLLTLLRGLPATEVRPWVVCAEGSALHGELESLSTVRAIPVRFALHSLPLLIRKLARQLEGVQVLQGTGFLTNVVSRRIGARTRGTVVNLVQVVPGAERVEGGRRIVSFVRSVVDRFTRHDVDRFVAVSRAVESALTTGGVPKTKIEIIPNGVDVSEIRRAAQSHPAEKQWGEGPRVGFVGRLERIKGCETFVRTVPLVAKTHPDATFIVAGAGSNESALRKLADQLGVSHRVQFAGFVSSVPSLLATLDVLVVPSLSDASSLVATEALALGIPVVASRVGGIPDIVVNEETGLLVEPGDEAAIAHAVERILRDPQLGQRLRAAGAAHVERRFTDERMVNEYLRIYRELACPGMSGAWLSTSQESM